jgi:PST family polysaccharide transporter
MNDAAPPPTSPPTTSDAIARKAGRGAKWAVAQSAGKHLIDLLVFLLLAKLVAPGAFGLVATASALMVVLAVLVEMGLGEALVQRQTLEPAHANTAFWSVLGLAGLLALVLLGLAPFIAQAWGQTALTPILQALAPLCVLQAANVVPQALLQRELNFRPLAVRALAGSVAGGAMGLTLALHDAGAWSLVGQQLTQAGVAQIGLWLGTRWRPARQWSRSHAVELLRFSRSVLAARLLNVAASKADDLIVGLFLGPVALGFYSVACRMLLALEQLFSQGVDAVALSAFSRSQGQKDALRQLYLSATGIAAQLAFPVFGGLSLLAPELVAAVLGPVWAPSAPLLRVLLLAGLVQALMHFNHAVFKAAGRPDLSMRLAISSTTLNIITLLIAVRYGPVAVAVSYLLRCALIAPIGLVLACRMMELPLRQYVRQTILQPALSTLAAGGVVLWLQTQFMAQWHPGATLAVCIVIGVSLCASAWWLSRRLQRRTSAA